MAPSHDLTALAALVLERREALRLGRRKAAEAGGLAPMTWNKVEASQPVQMLTYAGIEQALRWPRGSIRTFLDTGNVPQPAPEDDGDDVVGTGLRRASHEQLLEELRRRHEDMRAELSRRLYPVLAATAENETAESLARRGVIPGRPISKKITDATGDELA